MTRSASPTLELRQMREFTRREKDDLTRLWTKLIWRGGTGRLYSTLYWLWCGFGTFLYLSILMAVKPLAAVSPSLSDQLVFAATCFAVLFICCLWLESRLRRSKYWTGKRIDDRYIVTADGLNLTGARGAFSCGWKNIEDILNSDRHLIALLPGNAGVFIIKAAFAGQDVERFSTEFVRCWHAHRDAGAWEHRP
ncbi:MAG: hypothetical protein R3D05_06605 [Dongiaceae bacterium]